MKASTLGLVDELRSDCRKSLTRLGLNVGMRLGTVFKQVGRLERELVERYVALLNFSRVGFPIKLGLFVRADNKEDVRLLLSGCEHVNSLLRLSGGYDFFAELLFRDMVECQDFIEMVEAHKGVSGTRFCFLSDVLREAFRLGDGNGGGVEKGK